MKMQLEIYRFEYSFDKSGGDQGAFDLGDLPADFITLGIRTNVVSALTSDGNATVALGDGATADAFLTATAKTGFDTEDEMQVEAAILNHKATSAAKQQVTMTVGTADLTAGELEIYFYGFVPLHEMVGAGA